MQLADDFRLRFLGEHSGAVNKKAAAVNWWFTDRTGEVQGRTRRFTLADPLIGSELLHRAIAVTVPFTAAEFAGGRVDGDSVAG
jgi:hypothetical protein